jgi:DNA-binding ferritin-like protein
MINQDIITLLELRDKAHICHWETTSYSQHKALGKFYDGLLDLLDTFVETYMGKYGRMNLSGLAELKLLNPEQIIDETYYTVEDIEKQIDTKCTDLLNILADMKGLCNRTKYMLTLK